MEYIDKALYSYKRKKTQIEIDKIKLEEIDNHLYDIKAYSYDNIYVSSSHISNPTEKVAIEILNKKEKINKRIKYNTLFCKKIEMALNMLTNLERFIIEEVYFKNKNDNEIYNNLDYGISKTVFYKTKKKAKEKLRILIE